MNVRTYNGSGSLRYVENQVDCAFTLAQSSDGDVRLGCTTLPGTSPPAHWAAGLFGPMPVPEMFAGQLQDGRPIQVRGGFLAYPGGWNYAEGAKAFFELNGPGAEAVVGAVADAAEGGEWRFGITNLLLDSGHWKGEAGSREVAWTIDQLNVRVRDLTTEASRRLFGGKYHTDVTAHLELPGTLTLSDAREIAADLCSVLSIAQGTLIGCIYVERVSLPDDVAFTSGISRSLHRCENLQARGTRVVLVMRLTPVLAGSIPRERVHVMPILKQDRPRPQGPSERVRYLRGCACTWRRFSRSAS